MRGNITDMSFRSLEDYLVSRPLTIDGTGYDGGGAPFPVKGREIDATILFADIANFSGRTSDLSPGETLAFVNHFLTWIAAEALAHSDGIIDKYIGDEIMMVFSHEFGSDDPFAEAVSIARRFGEDDVFSFQPHIGIASGPVIVGYVGTPRKYACSVFGSTVAIAARCAGIRASKKPIGASIVFPAIEWSTRDFAKLFPPKLYKYPEGDVQQIETGWEMFEPRTEPFKNMGSMEVICIENRAFHVTSVSTAEWAKREVARIRAEYGRENRGT